MITVVQGRPGMGKTVYMVSEILRLSTRYQVYTNIEVKLPAWDKRAKNIHIITGLEDVTQVKHGKIVLDEVQTYLNSRNWDKLDQRFQLLLQQHRKRGLDILGATQSIRRADVVFRELVHVFYDIRKVITLKVGGLAFGVFILNEYDPDSIESASRDYSSIGWPIPLLLDPYTFSVYDTTQEYELRDPEGTQEIHRYVYKKVESYDKVLLEKKTL